ncbi:MAG: hypothetical protein WA803_09100 [Steroidobacteraceae bacterium]
MYPNSNSLYTSPLTQNVNPFATNPFALAGSIPNTMAPPFTNAFQGMVPQNPTWLQTSPLQHYSPQQYSPQFTAPGATPQLALQLAAQQFAQQLTGQQPNLVPLQQALHQLAQFHYWVAQQLAQLAAIPVPQGLFGIPYPNQFVPGAFGPNFGGIGTLN